MSFKALNEARWFLIPLVIFCLASGVREWWILFGFFLLVLIAVCLFFRDPKRVSPDNNFSIVAPADGLVDIIEKCDHLEALNGPGKRISIFLSVLDVHINRVPYKGTVKQIIYRRGAFLDARLPQCAEKNEQQLWIFDTDRGIIGVKQITGLIARRIVGWCTEGQQVETGQHLGLIRFGSRTELYVPMEVEVKVKVGDKVKGAQSVMAIWPH